MGETPVAVTGEWWVIRQAGRPYAATTTLGDGVWWAAEGGLLALEAPREGSPALPRGYVYSGFLLLIHVYINGGGDGFRECVGNSVFVWSRVRVAAAAMVAKQQ